MAIPGMVIAGKLLGKAGKKAAKAIPVLGAGYTAYEAYSGYNEAKAAGDDPARAATRGFFSTLGGVGGGALGALAGGGVASLATGVAGGIGGRAAGDVFGAELWDRFAKVPESPVPQPMTAEEQAQRRGKRTAGSRKTASPVAGKFRFGGNTPELAMMEMNVDAGKYVTDSRERMTKGDQYNTRYMGGLQAKVATGDQYNDRFMGSLKAKMVAGDQYNTRYMGGLELAGLKDTNRTMRDVQFGGFGVENRRTEAGRQIGLSNIEAQRQIGLDQGRTSRYNTQTVVGGQVRVNLDNNITSRQANQLQAGVMNNQTFAGERTSQRQFEAEKYIRGSGNLKTQSELALGLDTNRSKVKLGLDENHTQRHIHGSGDRKTDAQVEIARIAGGATQGQMQFRQQANNTANYQAYLAEERASQRQKKQLDDANQLGHMQVMGGLYR